MIIEGGIYEGYWTKGDMVEGRKISVNGTVYSGRWKHGEMKKGRLENNGDVYEGSFLGS